MPLGQNGLGVSADFVRHFAGATQRAVAANNHQINFTSLYQMSGSVVGDDFVGNALLRQFPGGQCRAL